MVWYQSIDDAWLVGGVLLIVALFTVVWFLFLGDTAPELDDWENEIPTDFSDIDEPRA